MGFFTCKTITIDGSFKVKRPSNDCANIFKLLFLGIADNAGYNFHPTLASKARTRQVAPVTPVSKAEAFGTEFSGLHPNVGLVSEDLRGVSDLAGKCLDNR